MASSDALLLHLHCYSVHPRSSITLIQTLIAAPGALDAHRSCWVVPLFFEPELRLHEV